MNKTLKRLKKLLALLEEATHRVTYDEPSLILINICYRETDPPSFKRLERLLKSKAISKMFNVTEHKISRITSPSSSSPDMFRTYILEMNTTSRFHEAVKTLDAKPHTSVVYIRISEVLASPLLFRTGTDVRLALLRPTFTYVRSLTPILAKVYLNDFIKCDTVGSVLNLFKNLKIGKENMLTVSSMRNTNHLNFRVGYYKSYTVPVTPEDKKRIKAFLEEVQKKWN